jgi:hypothetical protein
MSPITVANRESNEPADTRCGHQQRHVRVVGTETRELPSDLPVELVDQDQAMASSSRSTRSPTRRCPTGCSPREPTSRWAPTRPSHPTIGAGPNPS